MKRGKITGRPGNFLIFSLFVNYIILYLNFLIFIALLSFHPPPLYFLFAFIVYLKKCRMVFSQQSFRLEMWKRHWKSFTREKKSMPGCVLFGDPFWTSGKKKKKKDPNSRKLKWYF